MDQLLVQGLKVKTKIGVHAWEQQIEQLLLIDICILTNLQNSQDILANTIDYANLCDLVTKSVENHSFNLIETVATHVAALIQENVNHQTVTVTINKPGAVGNANNIAVTITIE
ncbi:MAG: dihydroneopterin aldolase [Legionellales bacterium RIFCSPHIGHO2_12_FULL_42_9]|nr:MAG: dihydroneopterin aldolase [Legionellales bacterium RIFCSPHIGHO2_12_FULL_42_9]